MPKLRKQRMKKVYRHNVNRKRLRNKITKVGNIGCKEIKDAWDEKKSVQYNLEQMGLSYNPNTTIPIPNRKKQLKEAINGDVDPEEKLNNDGIRRKTYVAETLEADAKAPREKRLRLPNSQVEWITYLMKKYGRDYKAMARDSKNYYQETWKQLRQKIRLFKKIPEQYSKFLEDNGLAPDFAASDNTSDDEL